jgi:hypothetical protein
VSVPTGETGEVGVAEIGPITALALSLEGELRRCRMAWAAGDRLRLPRMAEHYLLGWQECDCPDHSCAACTVRSRISAGLDVAFPATLTDEEITRARDDARAAHMRGQLEYEAIRDLAHYNCHDAIRRQEEDRLTKRREREGSHAE